MYLVYELPVLYYCFFLFVCECYGVLIIVAFKMEGVRKPFNLWNYDTVLNV